MKVGDKSDSSERAGLRELLRQDSSKSANEVRAVAERIKAQTQGTLLKSDDSVNVSVAKAIGQELSPEALALERRQKIESLKAIIAEGKYNPPSEAVAQAVGQEILFEIFSGGTNLVEGGDFSAPLERDDI
jgi:anti-sigma28 factor (negative regulator of flagellin synthesis)